MTITVQDQVARAEFSQAATASTEDCGPGATLEFDADGDVVAASFVSRSGAARLVRTLARYKMTLSSDDIDDVLSVF